MENRTEQFEITINSESEISPELLIEFIENFNSLEDENIKIRIMLIVRDLAKAKKN